MRKIFVLSILLISQVAFGQPDSASSPQKIKILSWNIYMLPGLFANLNGRRAEAIGNHLAASDYDVMVFQEAFCVRARHKLRQRLKKKFPYQAGPANRKSLSLRTNSGLMIFSKYPIARQTSIRFKNREGTDALSRKGALLVELRVGKKMVQIAATHLQNSGAPWLRHVQCVELYERLLKPNEKEGVPQVLCGDFNIDKNTSADSYHFMLSSLDAADGDLGSPVQFSYDRLTNDLKIEKGTGRDLIDYILIRNTGAHIEHRRITMIKKPWHTHHHDLSDHYSLEAEIVFTPYPDLITLR